MCLYVHEHITLKLYLGTELEIGTIHHCILKLRSYLQIFFLKITVLPLAIAWKTCNMSLIFQENILNQKRFFLNSCPKTVQIWIMKKSHVWYKTYFTMYCWYEWSDKHLSHCNMLCTHTHTHTLTHNAKPKTKQNADNEIPHTEKWKSK